MSRLALAARLYRLYRARCTRGEAISQTIAALRRK